ncbi:MAG: methyltransferase [Dermatophilaceae bacterium]
MTITTAAPTAQLAPQQPAHEIVWELSNAILASRALHVVAELGVADHIGEEPVTASSLAGACDASADALDRALRLLVTFGLFRRTDEGYRHTEASRLLRSDHPRSMRAFARLNGLPVCSAAFAQLEHSVRTGSPAVELVDPNGFWHYLQDHPDQALVFEQAMTGKAHADVAAVLQAYDFSRRRRIADVAGGHGHLIEAVLGAHPDVTGLLFELPHVAADVAPTARLEVAAGDFFTDALPPCDAYLLMNIVHDWDDPDAVAILTAVADAGRHGATVLVVEAVLPDGPERHWAQTLDVLMLAVTGGRERTCAEYGRLLDAAGIDLVRTLPTMTPFSILEGRVR